MKLAQRSPVDKCKTFKTLRPNLELAKQTTHDSDSHSTHHLKGKSECKCSWHSIQLDIQLAIEMTKSDISIYLIMMGLFRYKFA